jgi:hypothetical protein
MLIKKERIYKEVVVEYLMQMAVFWVVAPCSLVEVYHF